MITPLQKTPLIAEIDKAIKKWADQKGVYLEEDSGISVSIQISEKLLEKEELPRKRLMPSLEWTTDEVTDDDINSILKNRITQEPRLILEEFLVSGTRVMDEELVERVKKTLDQKNIPHRSRSDVLNKAQNMNHLFIRLKLPYRIKLDRQFNVPDKFPLRKVKFVKRSVPNRHEQIQISISGEIKITGHRYAKA